MDVPKPDAKINLLDLNIGEIASLIKELGEKSFRGKQVFQWIYKYGVFDFDKMTDIPKNFRARLFEKCEIAMPEVAEKLVSADKLTEKFAFLQPDGAIVEAVKIFDNEDLEKYTICVSTQVGCPVNCPFCQTGKMGFKRNLSQAEILAQVLRIVFEKKGRESGLSNVVYMGMGEPFFNFCAVMRSIRVINSEQGLNISMRKMTVSTSGVVEGILDLIKEKIPVTLAISLHAAEDGLRDRLVPINKKYDILKIINAVKKYTGETSRRVTFEYVMINGVNDSMECAKKLAALLKGLLCHVNLISLNKTAGEFSPSPVKRMFMFKNALEMNGVNATIRRSKGTDINAACGMLYKKLKNSREDMIDEDRTDR